MKITAERREYMRKYQRAWIACRRNEWIKSNGPCKRCGSKQSLEVDHINPAEKSYEMSAVWSLSKEKREAELAKCQVLCHDCHAAKTSEERVASGLYDRLRIKSPVGKAWCYVREHFVDVTGFGKNSAKPDGRQDECTSCRKEKRSPKFASMREPG